MTAASPIALLSPQFLIKKSWFYIIKGISGLSFRLLKLKFIL